MLRWAPYLNFRGNARKAMEHYQSIFGGELILNTADDLGIELPAQRRNQVMHAQLTTSAGIVLLASDIHAEDTDQQSSGNLHSIMVYGDEAETTQVWERLTENGTITVPLARSAWGDFFGATVDEYGVTWLVNSR
ncbi:VOC family protein [Gryllotalpicola protaetiae]|uniref:VOC family protein n=1 Tax=Gryllotalpicola protaetiae TaxID=2419771 RepID=A0A387BJN0_9MICO|nr:VOC family protein [Gryllotalpicola protaetiae]AYG04043.1 VOC family protein [Gryllotalpicola protaetiae]